MPLLLIRPRFGPVVVVPPAAAGFVAHARYTLEVAWGANAQGAFVIGVSTIGGTDTLAVSPFDVTFTGLYDNLSTGFRGGNIDRGRDDQRAFVVSGEAKLVVRDPTGLLNPENQSSPLVNMLQGRYQHVRLRGYLADGTMLPLFYGFLERIDWHPLRRQSAAGVATLTCKDLLLWLNEARPVIAATGPTTTGAAIGKVLDAVGWNNPAARSLAVGDPIPDFSATGDLSALQLIGDLLAAERGVFYMDAAGIAVYEDRQQRTLKTSAGTVANEMKAAVPSVDHSRLRNRVRVKRSQSGYTATAIDSASRTLIGNRDLEDIETAYLDSDSRADALANFILDQLGQPLAPMRDLKIDNRTEALLRQCMAREFGDVVTLTAAGAGIVNPDYMIEQIRHLIDLNRWRHETTWLLSQHRAVTPFQIGVSTLAVAGSTEGHVLIY